MILYKLNRPASEWLGCTLRSDRPVAKARIPSMAWRSYRAAVQQSARVSRNRRTKSDHRVALLTAMSICVV